MKLNPDISFKDMMSLPAGHEKAAQIAVHGLLTDGSHHKQWSLEQVLVALGVDLDELRADLLTLDYDWDEGIPP